MLKLFSKEKALYLVDNPTKVGFSWWFFFTAIATGCWIHKQYGDSEFIIMVVEKYGFLAVCLIFGLTRNWVAKRVRNLLISRDSLLLYLIPPAGYVITFFATLWITHMFFGFAAL